MESSARWRPTKNAKYGVGEFLIYLASSLILLSLMAKQIKLTITSYGDIDVGLYDIMSYHVLLIPAVVIQPLCTT